MRSREVGVFLGVGGGARSFGAVVEFVPTEEAVFRQDGRNIVLVRLRSVAVNVMTAGKSSSRRTGVRCCISYFEGGKDELSECVERRIADFNACRACVTVARVSRLRG